jgi:DNA-binding beta-propeller fold protein YncE
MFTSTKMIPQRLKSVLPDPVSFLKIFLYAFLLCSVFFLAGCKTAGGIGGTRTVNQSLQYQKAENDGWLTIFLNLKEAAGPELVLDVASVEIRSGSSWIPLRSVPIMIDTKKLGGGQKFIARNGVQPGSYDALRFVFQDVSEQRGDGPSLLSMAASTVEMDLPMSLDVQQGDSSSLFVTWDVMASLTGHNTFEAAMVTNLQAIPLLVDLLFVACPELDSVYVVRTDRNWVISSIGIPDRPTYMDVDTSLNRFYILSSDERTILVYDLNTNRISDRYFIPMDNKPSFMLVGPQKRFAYLLDEIGKSISRVDLLNGSLEITNKFAYQPNYALFLEDQKNLVVSASDTNVVYFLNPETLENVGAVPVGNYPQGLAAWNNLLFVAESNSNTVTSYRINDRQQESKINVGFQPRRLILKNDQLYVTNFRNSTITIMLPGQLNVSGEIFVGGRPFEMAKSVSRRWLYAGDMENGRVSVIDATSNRIKGIIDLQALPLGMAVID